MKIKYSEIIRNQPTINIGVIGHVAHGKSTFTRSMTGTKTQKFSSEQERNITIHIGYANTKIFMDKDGDLHTATSNTNSMKDEDGEEMVLIKHVSFVDCPGHEAFMSNMISGSAIMDTCVLVIACNDKVPQPQTYEHLQAVQNVDIDKFLILQNKMDLIKEHENENVYNQIKQFIKDTKAEKSRIIPSSIQNNINKDEILKSLVSLPRFQRDLEQPAKMIIIRSFDINKAHTSFEDMSGGVVGGSLISGILKVNDIVELRPGYVIKGNEGEFKFRPIITTIRSLQSDTSKMDYALPGGLVGVCLDVDPSLTKSNGLNGQMIGLIGTLPNVYSALKLEYEELKRYDNIDDSFKMNETLLISVNSMNIKATIMYIKKKKNYIKVQLEKPVCVTENQKVAIFKNVSSRWLLVAKSVITDGMLCERDSSDKQYEEIANANKFVGNDIDIEYDLPVKNFKISDYDSMLDNINFKSESSYIIKIIPPQIKIINKETIFTNFNKVCESIKLKIDNDVDVDYPILINQFINNELSCSSQMANGTLIIKGRFKTKMFEAVITKFIKRYLKCFSCNSFKCYLLRQNRKYFRQCMNCNSKSCVDYSYKN